MELKQMEYFKTVVDAGSISAAAKILNMSQPPLSTSMKNLESELNTKLLIRGNRFVQTTEAGSIFYQRICRILELSNSVKDEVASMGDYKSLALGLTPSTIPVVTPLLSKFSKLHPNVHFQIYDGSTFELQHLLENRVINFAFLRTPFASGDLSILPIKKDPMVACFPNMLIKGDARIKSNSTVTLNVLSDYPLSVYRRYMDLIKTAFSGSELTPTYFSICDDARTSLMWSEAGMAVAIFPKSLTDKINNCVLCDIKHPDLETYILFAHRKSFSEKDYISQEFTGFCNNFIGDGN